VAARLSEEVSLAGGAHLPLNGVVSANGVGQRGAHFTLELQGRQRQSSAQFVGWSSAALRGTASRASGGPALSFAAGRLFAETLARQEVAPGGSELLDDCLRRPTSGGRLRVGSAWSGELGSISRNGRIWALFLAAFGLLSSCFWALFWAPAAR